MSRAVQSPFGTAIIDDDEFDKLHDFHDFSDVKAELGTRVKLDSMRGFLNMLALLVLALALLGIFMVWPVTIALRRTSIGSRTAGFNLGGINATGQYPEVYIPSLIDPDTPRSAYSRQGYDGETWDLAFSDEFNQEGRTFFPGDDPVWEGMDMHYWGTV